MTKWNTLGARFVLLFCAITIPLIILLFLFVHYANGVVLSQVAKSYQNLVNSNCGLIDRSLEDITKNMMDIVYNDDNFQKFGQPGLSESDTYLTQIQLIHRNMTYQSYYHTVDMFFIYSRPSDRLFSTDMFGAASDMKDAVRVWIADSFHDPQLLKQLMYRWSVVRIQDQYFLYRLVSDDITNNAYIGAIINVNSLIAPLGDLELRSGGEVLLVADDGTVLSNPNGRWQSIRHLPADKLRDNRAFSFNEGGSRLLVVNSRSANSGISMAVVLSNAALLKGLRDFQTMINLLPLAAVAILMLYIVIFRSMLFKPISQLLRAIRRIKEGDMTVRLPETGISEFAIINRSFNQMLEEITDLKIDVYEGRLRSQKAEMKQLQLQINPHFFLNTLNIVYQLADLKRHDLVQKAVRHLVHYFRFMLHAKDGVIPLSQELDHIRHYLEIQKMRYRDAFEFDIRVADDLREARIPSLLIQPLVENAILHGMSLKNAPFVLRLAAGRVEGEPGRWAVELCDNGKGMPPEKLAELNAADYAPVSDNGHIGIWNVKRRLAMRYGGQAELVFYPNEPSGLGVRLALPLEPAEEATEDVRYADRGR